MQANYQLVLPNIRDYLSDIGAVVSMAGVVIGCCDIASIPGTIGRLAPSSTHGPLWLHTSLQSAPSMLHCASVCFPCFMPWEPPGWRSALF